MYGAGGHTDYSAKDTDKRRVSVTALGTKRAGKMRRTCINGMLLETGGTKASNRISDGSA